MKNMKWQETVGGGAKLTTGALHLDVRPRDGGGFECVVYNAGRYSALGRFPHPVAGDVADAKRVCLSVARKVLADEQAALDTIE